MASAAVGNPPPATSGESKSAQKKKAKAEAAANGSPATPATPEVSAKDESAHGDSSGAYEHPHLKELQKQIRNVNKRLTGLHKTDAIIEANPGTSLDELVAQRKINVDQKAAAEKKPQLQAQLQQLEDHVKTFRSVNSDYQSQLQKQKEELTAQHQKELEKAKEDLRQETASTDADELRKKLLVFSQFLRAAAAKRTNEEEAGTDENMAFEGALLLVYGGDQKAVETAVNIIEGTDEQVPNIEGTPLPVKYAQIKQASIDHAPFQTEEAWANDVAEANAATGYAAENAVPEGSDPTVAHAGLTELDTTVPPNGAPAGDYSGSAVQASAGDEVGNLASERWDAGTGAEKGGIDDSFEMIPRPNEEVDTPTEAPPAYALEQEKVGSWADEATTAAPQATGTQATGNQAGEGWDLAAAGVEPAAPVQSNGLAKSGTTAAEATTETDDGFQQIAGRHQHRGRGRGRGDGEFRGRGGRGRGGFRGDRGSGEGKGGRGGRGRGEFRGGRGDGEHRGRGGRGRGGPKGEGHGQAPRTAEQ